mgnify:FL=1
MKITDLSHIINNDITVFNEAEKPEITISSTHEKDGYAQKKLSMYSHNSTHVDAPFHIIPGTATLDRLSPEKFYGNAVVADCRNIGKEINVGDLEKYADKLKEADFIILNTGWYKKWNTPEYKFDFPALTEDAAEWMLQFNLKGIGLDTISIDPFESTDLPVHKIILGNNMIIIENLTNLDTLLDVEFIFSCFPLRIEDADGSPTRAVGIR